MAILILSVAVRKSFGWNVQINHLQKNGIGCGFHYKIPLHQQPALKHLGYKKGDFPVTEKVVNEIISLPMYPELIEEKIHFVVNNIKEFLNN